jgi:uncharacterized membrane-anchored protein YhcB (DUF1043 family)
MTEANSGENVWKNIALFLAGVVLTMVGTLTTMAHDSIPRSEVDQKIHDLYTQMDKQQQGLSDRLSRIEQTQSQMGQDIARISEHLGVSARPVTPH